MTHLTRLWQICRSNHICWLLEIAREHLPSVCSPVITRCRLARPPRQNVFIQGTSPHWNVCACVHVRVCMPVCPDHADNCPMKRYSPVIPFPSFNHSAPSRENGSDDNNYQSPNVCMTVKICLYCHPLDCLCISAHSSIVKLGGSSWELKPWSW